MRRAPASSAFSTNSFSAEAGRSTTSPAAMRLIAASSSRRIFGSSASILWAGDVHPPIYSANPVILLWQNPRRPDPVSGSLSLTALPPQPRPQQDPQTGRNMSRPTPTSAPAAIRQGGNIGQKNGAIAGQNASCRALQDHCGTREPTGQTRRHRASLSSRAGLPIAPRQPGKTSAVETERPGLASTNASLGSAGSGSSCRQCRASAQAARPDRPAHPRPATGHWAPASPRAMTAPATSPPHPPNRRQDPAATGRFLVRVMDAPRSRQTSGAARKTRLSPTKTSGKRPSITSESLSAAATADVITNPRQRPQGNRADGSRPPAARSHAAPD